MPDSLNDIILEYAAGEEHDRLRLDVFLAGLVEDASRSFIQGLIKGGRVTVNSVTRTRPSHPVLEGDEVAVSMPPAQPSTLEPAAIPLEFLYQDDDVAVILKPSGMVVHPAPGHHGATLVNALLHHCPEIRVLAESQADRPGIVHRLDRDTSGVLVVAKTPRAYVGLSRQAREHTFDRHYLALVRGEYQEGSGRIVAAVGRSMTDRKRMSVTGVQGREAITRFRVMERFGIASLLQLELETGRTHQIRVHMRFTGHAILGDPVYGVTDFHEWSITPEIRSTLESLEGQALHAERLGFEHPVSHERMLFTAPPPADFQAALNALRASLP